MSTSARPVHPAHQLLSERLEQVAEATGAMLHALTGQVTPMILFAFPPDDSHAVLAVYNSTREQVIQFLTEWLTRAKADPQLWPDEKVRLPAEDDA